jgi:SAM-dependent methyltransferase
MTPNTEFPALVDPLDGQPLVPGPGGLSSGTRTFPVIDGIPRLVPGSGTYADAFGDQWNRWQRTQLDSFTGVPISRHRLERCLGPALLGDLADPGRVLDVCEAGCGAGRFTEVLIRLPGVRLTSIDLSSAVDANQRNCPQDRRHRIVQCDVCNPPFRADSFDVVVCLGVIQHTPSPEATIRCLYSLVRPGGWLVIDHYAPSWSHWTKLGSLLLRPVLKRLSPAARMRACEALTSALLPIHKAACRNPIARTVVSRFSPLLTYYHTYPELTDDHHREWAVLDTHDSLTDWYKHLRTPSRIRTTLVELGADEISSVSGGNGVEARCRKPGPSP